MSSEIVCKFYQNGYCKFRNQCRHQHVETVCETINCRSRECMLRHPRECKYYQRYGRCKFNSYCLFKHSDTPCNVESDLEKKVLELIEHTVNEKVDLFIKKMEEKIEKFESILEVLEEKHGQEVVLTQNRGLSLESQAAEQSLIEVDSPARPPWIPSCCSHVCQQDLNWSFKTP